VNPFGHIDLRVADMDAALAFYDALLPELGFTVPYHGEAWKVWATPDPAPSAAYFALTEKAGHAANENRIAFRVDSAQEVDRLAEAARQAGAQELSGPKEMPYGPGYYAVYFDDPSGNRLEVYVRPEWLGRPSVGLPWAEERSSRGTKVRRLQVSTIRRQMTKTASSHNGV
jgi:catechol 2,3-dioxygenase-like lactoylglutathione lyase family enzyme